MMQFVGLRPAHPQCKVCGIMVCEHTVATVRMLDEKIASMQTDKTMHDAAINALKQIGQMGDSPEAKHARMVLEVLKKS